MSYLNNSSLIYENECLHIKRMDQQEVSFLIFIFKGKFTFAACEEACHVWDQTVQLDPSVAYTHIWNCESMTGFDQRAKNRWMSCMTSNAAQTKNIWMVSDNILIRGAARLMSKFSKHELRVFKTNDEVQAMIPKP